MTDTYGQRCLELSENLCPLGLLVKMCLELFPSLTQSSKAWKAKVTPQNRSLSRLVSSAPPIKGKGYGLLPTVTAGDATAGAVIDKNDTFKLTGNGTVRRYNQNGHNSSLSLGRLLTLKNGSNLLPSPITSKANRRIEKASPCRAKGRNLEQRLGVEAPALIGQHINPQFLEWMMGYPIGWTEIKLSETP